MNLRGAILGSAAALALGCGGGAQPVTISVQAPSRDGQVQPIEGATITIVPFDIDSVYTALEEKNQPGPRPDSTAVESLYQAFTAADSALIAAESTLVSRQRTLEGISDRASPEYRAAFQAFEQADRQRTELSAARDSAEATYAPAREAYQRARTTWEGSAWDGFTPIQEQLYGQVEAPTDSAGNEIPFQERTRADGTFTVYLQPGRWWAAGRAPVPGSVRTVYRWNEGFTVGDGPVTVELTGDNAIVLNTY
jgi:hypothetical protein